MVLKDPNEDQDDILRANRSREKQYIFDCAFGPSSDQVIISLGFAYKLTDCLSMHAPLPVDGVLTTYLDLAV